MVSRRSATIARAASLLAATASGVLQHGEVAGLVPLHLAGAEALVLGESRLQGGQAGDHTGVGLGAVDDDLDGVDLADREVALQLVQALLGVEAVGEPGAAFEAAGLHVEDRRRRPAASTATAAPSQGSGWRMMLWARRAQTPSLGPCVEPARRRRGARAGHALRQLADERHAQRVDAIAEQADQRRQEGQGRDERGEHDQDRAQAETDGDVHGHHGHADHGDHDREAAEEDGAAGRCSGRRDSVGLGQPAAALLAIAADDEQRVVDAHREAQHRDDVRREHAHRVELPDQRDQAEREQDRDDAQQQRHAGRDQGAEHEDQHDEGRRHAEDLGLLEVGLRQLHGGRLHAGLAGLVGREPGAGACGDDVVHVGDVVRGTLEVVGQVDDQQLGVTVFGDHRGVLGLGEGDHAGDLVGTQGGQVVGQRRDLLLEGGVVDREVVVAHHDQLAGLVRSAHAFVDQAAAPWCCREACRAAARPRSSSCRAARPWPPPRRRSGTRTRGSCATDARRRRGRGVR